MGIQKMSIEQRHPIVMKKAQLGSDQCSLSTVLPMSCRGRAEAFARRLHTRLRNLGTPETTSSTPSSINAQDLFYEFDLDYEGPSSPAEAADIDHSSACHHNDSDCDSLYLDAEEGEILPVNQGVKLANFNKFNRLYDGTLINNNSKATTNRNNENSIQRENGHGEKKLYSPICLEDCTRRESALEENGVDEVDTTSWSQQISSVILPSVHQIVEATSSVQTKESHSVKKKSCLDLSINGYKDSEASNLDTPSKTIAEEVEVATIENGLGFISETEPLISSEDINLSSVIVAEEASIEVENSSELPESDMTLLHIDERDKNSSEEENEIDDKPQRVRRCSSLKTGKTPPGTPGRKKIVRFADVLGLDLADVKTFMDDIPTIPKSAYLDLLDADVNTPPPAYPKNGLKKLSDKYIVPMFQPPCIQPNFMDTLNEKYVCLETATVSEGATVTICGSVRVRNLDFHKSVHIRYTMNGWKTYTDLQAVYVPGTCDGFSDKFHFTLYAPAINVGQKLEFAVRFQCKGCQYWDNNSGINYCYQCLPFIGNPNVNTNSPPLTVHPMENWHPSFY